MFKRLVLFLFVIALLFSPSQVSAAGCEDFGGSVTYSPTSLRKGDSVTISTNITKVPEGYRFLQKNDKPNSSDLAQCAQSGANWTCKLVGNQANYRFSAQFQSITGSDTIECFKAAAIIADTSGGANTGGINTGTPVTASKDEPPGLPEVQILFGRAITAFGVIIFMALTVMLVVAGVRFITSGGEAKPLQQAQQTMTWAILGILFLVLAWLFLLMVARFTGRPDILQFNLKFG